MSPRVTIGMPVYQAEKTVGEAIRSVLRQTWTDYELLVVDDGSTDGTIEVIRIFQDDRVRVVADGEHRGIAARLNQMVREAQGEYFARMDADDVMMPERLARQMTFILAHPEADVIGCSALVMDDSGNVMGKRNETSGLTVSETSTIRGSWQQVDRLMHPTLLGRTEWFRANPYNEAYSGCEDWELWLRVRDKATLLRMNEPLMYYRERTTFNIRRVWRERIVGLCVIWKYRKQIGSFTHVLLQLANNLMVMMAVPFIHLLHLDYLVIKRKRILS